jgi:hypothetical protein
VATDPVVQSAQSGGMFGVAVGLLFWATGAAVATDPVVQPEDWRALQNRPARNQALREQAGIPCSDNACSPPGGMQPYKTIVTNYMPVLGDDALAPQLDAAKKRKKKTPDACVAGKEFYAGAGTCAPLTECGAHDEFVAIDPTPVTDRVCDQCRPPCDTATEYEVRGCGGGSSGGGSIKQSGDRVCGVKSQCKDGEYEAGPGGIRTKSRDCQPCSICTLEKEQYMTTACGKNADTTCRRLTQCSPGQFEKIAATPTSDRVCASMLEKPSCPPGTFQVGLGKADTTDRECQMLSNPCKDGWFEVSPPTPEQDRICKKKGNNHNGEDRTTDKDGDAGDDEKNKSESDKKKSDGSNADKAEETQNLEYKKRVHQSQRIVRAKVNGEEARKRNNVPTGCHGVLARASEFGMYHRPWKIGDCLQSCAIDWRGDDEIDCYDACLCRAGVPPAKRKDIEACSLPPAAPGVTKNEK